MSVIFGSWKYIFKNLWYVLPCAIVPGVFLALSLDYTCVSSFVSGIFSGNPRMDFLGFFRVWSVLRIDSALGAIYSFCALFCLMFFMSVLLALIEKHMRLGKRTPNGAFSQWGHVMRSSVGLVLAYFVLYEIWAVVLSAVLFAVSASGSAVLVYFLDLVVIAAFVFALCYLTAALYLWLPCKLITGFRPMEAFLYSYRLAAGMRGRLLLSFLLFYVSAAVLLAAAALLPEWLFRLIAVLLYMFLFLDFCVRMETAYFEGDKLDREDLLHSYKEYWS